MSRTRVVVAAAALLAGCGARSNDKPKPAPAKDAGVAVVATDAAAVDEVVVLPPAPPLPEVPAGLPPLPALEGVTPEAVALGERLFQERALSSTGALACTSCHDPAHGFSGGTRQPTAEGKTNARRAPSLVNLAWQREFGWDGRYRTLAEQLEVHVNGQLGHPTDAAVARIASDPTYRAHFARNGGGEPNAPVAVAALAAYVQTRYAGGSPWDGFERGEAPPALRSGYQLFTGKAQCSVCHTPPLYTDLRYHALGLVALPDEGRGRIDPAQAGAFKTPTLRGAAARTGFFHDASAPTLAAAIDWHLAGGTGAGATAAILDPALRPVTLSPAERAQLGAFVEALTAR